jgi:hypothetical protein
MPHIMNLKKLRFVHFNKVKRESKAADPARQGLKKHCLLLSNAIISKSMR